MISFSTLALGQQSNDSQDEFDNYEIRLNASHLLGLGFLEISYEKLLKDEESVLGISLGYSFDKSIDYDFSIVPYYRVYFGKKKVAGFFAEAHTALYSEESKYNENEIGLGVGFSIGGKFVTKKGWTFELVYGAGRNFINDDKIRKIYQRKDCQLVNDFK